MASNKDSQRKLVENLLSDPETNYRKIIKAEERSSQINKQQSSIQSATAAYTTGSTAAAGSGDFHIAKAVRRRAQDIAEEEKLQDLKEKNLTDFAEKKKKLAEEDSAKTRKNREKRKKRKLNGKFNGKLTPVSGTCNAGLPNVAESDADILSSGVSSGSKDVRSKESAELGGAAADAADAAVESPDIQPAPVSSESKSSIRIVDYDDEDFI